MNFNSKADGGEEVLTAKGPMLRDGALKGKVAIVTGGGTGLGREMAKTFAHLGCNVCVASRKQEVIEDAARELRQFGVKALAVPTDVRSPEQVDALIERTTAELGPIDILVNNAAGNFTVKSLDMSVNAWKSVVEIVLNGTWFCSQRAARAMTQTGRGGVILNIVSTHAMTGNPYTVHSASAKAGVIAMTKTLAVEWASLGIRVNAIAPGPIEDTGAVRQLWPDPEKAAYVLSQIPAGRMANKAEVADMASYLVSDYASYITGSTFVIDGGRWLSKGAFSM
ncbi:SDR family oxidoreductase [Alicyclobacillus tolerans]|uniref:SDR family oxidoreductase n=1 Tax=Alicyclobacillus tolerans TaxID=90970 RepID=UPI001F2E4E0F|nr:SDR family oxidoreductase [Alicyclobacillus tolerans]MCF8567126.1 SDR family oxidoreductase [Alicyclobacillus tolerans]